MGTTPVCDKTEENLRIKDRSGTPHREWDVGVETQNLASVRYKIKYDPVNQSGRSTSG